jgi:hypothetical protein
MTVVAGLAALCLSLPARATPTQEEVFKSIQSNVGESTDPKTLLAILAVLAGIVLVLVMLSNRRKRVAQPRTLNHQGKLLREVLGEIDLKSAELKQLKSLADEQQLGSPLTLLLCPSQLTKAVKESGGKVDKRAIVGIARKLA